MLNVISYHNFQNLKLPIKNNGIETCKISCMKQVASPGSMHDTGCLGLVHWDDPEKEKKKKRKMVTITLYARQKKRHRCIEQSFGLCGRGRGWDDLREGH